MDLATRLQVRSRLYEAIRAYFKEQAVTEVHTPLLSFAANPDPAIASFSMSASAADAPAMYLQTSPEFFMKRLLVQGSGSIFQICNAFRQGESGRLHNPEFSMLEWYRVGFDYVQLMQDVSRLVCAVTGDAPETQVVSYAALFRPYAIEPHTDPKDSIEKAARHHGIDVQSRLELTRDDWLDLFMTHVIEPALDPDKLVFIHAYPSGQACLARLVDSGKGYRLAQRFELYWRGMELANGFAELDDAAEQRQRFEEDNRVREQQGLPVFPLDEHFLAALERGLPACSGVALGLDRLLMIMTGSNRIAEVLNFPDGAV